MVSVASQKSRRKNRKVPEGRALLRRSYEEPTWRHEREPKERGSVTGFKKGSSTRKTVNRSQDQGHQRRRKEENERNSKPGE